MSNHPFSTQPPRVPCALRNLFYHPHSARYPLTGLQISTASTQLAVRNRVLCGSGWIVHSRSAASSLDGSRAAFFCTGADLKGILLPHPPFLYPACQIHGSPSIRCHVPFSIQNKPSGPFFLPHKVSPHGGPLHDCLPPFLSPSLPGFGSIPMQIGKEPIIAATNRLTYGGDCEMAVNVDLIV